MSDARLELVSVTGVDTAPNLRQAVVYVDVLGEEQRSDALHALQGAAKRLQSVLGTEVRMKYTPTLEFRIDPGIAGGERIDEILRGLRDDAEEDGLSDASNPDSTETVSGGEEE
jgi:ribosome-binding factor A